MQLVPEVPVETDELTLGVTVDPLTVTAELRVVLRQKEQARVDPRPEGVDETLVAEMGADFPMGSNRTEVHDGGVGNRWLLGGRLGVRHGRGL